MATKSEIAKIVDMLIDAYPKFDLRPGTLETYYKLLKDLPSELLEGAALECTTKRDFFPSVHELRLAATQIKRQALKIPTAYQAWNDLIRSGDGETTTLNKTADSSYEIIHDKYKFLHPLVEHVGRMLGYPKHFPGENIVADRAHYYRAYEDELQNLLDLEVQLPEVKEYINQKRRLQAGDIFGSKGVDNESNEDGDITETAVKP